MNKKKYFIIIAIVIFVFLAIFAFANPLNNEEGEPNDNRVLEEIEEDDVINNEEENEEQEQKEQQVVAPIYPIYNDHGVNVTNKPLVVVDDSYEKALEAVKEAETALDLESLETATKLVKLVKDETKKSKLEERLIEVKEIIDLIDFVDTLVKDVNQATSKSDMDDIREYVVESDMVERISELSNEAVQEELIKKLESIATKVDDVKAPEVNIEDGAILNTDTKIIVTDDSEVIIKLNDEKIENNTIVSEGEYTLEATDESFNSVKITFIIDKIAPELTIVNPEKYELEILSEYEDKGYSAMDDVSGDVTELVELTYVFQAMGTSEWEEVDELDTSVLGTYKITYTAYDEAGNSKEGTREVEIVDTTNPIANVTFANGTTYVTVEDATEVQFEVYKDDVLKNTYASEEIGKTLELASDLLDAGKYVVKVLDQSANETTVDVYVAGDLKEALTYTDEVTLQENLEFDDNESLVITRGQNKVINLNGKKITGKTTVDASSYLIKVETGSSLKLEGDGEISFLGTEPDTNWGPNAIKPFPTYAHNTISNSGKLVVDGPTIINNTPRGGASYAIDNYPGADLKVLSGTIHQAGGDVAIRLFANSSTVTTKVTINGGTILGYRAIWVQIPGSNPAIAQLADVTINGGTLTSTDSVYNMALYSYSFGNSFAKTNVTINGGTFNGGVAFGGGYKGDKENVTIDGGIFNSYVGRYLENDGWEDLQ